MKMKKNKKKKVCSERENQVRCSRTVLYFTTAIKHSRANVVYSNIYSIAKDSVCTGVLINPLPDQEGNKVMFLSEWREFPTATCLAGGKKT